MNCTYMSKLLGILVVFLGITSVGAAPFPVKDEDPIKLQLFELSDVCLLGSPFKRAMELDEDYLLKFDSDPISAKPPMALRWLPSTG